jgi:hypothetical protein
MDMNVSPDLDAWVCYLLVLLLGMWSGGAQISKRLGNLPGKWIMVNTWALFFAYTAVPVALFWLLDRTGAIHDTSLFAAILVGVGYQSILSGTSGTIRAPGELSAFWQPFATWADLIGGRIRDRVALNSQKFDEVLLSQISANPGTLETLQSEVMIHASDPAKLVQDLAAFDIQIATLGPDGVARKKAELLYQTLKMSAPKQFDYLLYKKKITGAVKYFWLVKEWRSKAVALAVGLVLLLAFLAGLRELRQPKYLAAYYTWRLTKDGTDYDRYRARTNLVWYLESNPDSFAPLIAKLKTPALPVKTADAILSLAVELKDCAARHHVDLRGELADAMRSDNSDVRERVQRVLLYLAENDHITVPHDVSTWHSDPKNSISEIDTLIGQWHSLKPGATPVNDATVHSGQPPPAVVR